MDSNYSLIGKILKRYSSSDEKAVEIFLTSPGYQKGIGDHNCWIFSDGLQVKELIKGGLFELLESPLRHQDSPQGLPEAHVVKIYHGYFFIQKAKDWYEIQSLKKQKKLDWFWHNKEKGEYKFGKQVFKVSGKKRKKVFWTLMDLYEKSPFALSTKSLSEMAGIDAKRLRIDISEINKRLKKQLKLYFKGSGPGFYTLEKYSKTIK